MRFTKYYEQLERIKDLAKRGATGTLTELSDRLEVSRSTTKRMISALRDMGVPIEYSRARLTYYIKGETPF